MSGLGLGGLVSGVNTDDILKKIMDLESARVDRETQRKAELQAKQDAWHKVKDQLTTLRTKLDGIRLASAFRVRRAVLSDDSVASITVATGATLATHKLTDVTQLARAQMVGSGLQNSATTGLTVSGKFTVNGKEISVASQDTLYTLRDKINGTADVGVIAEVVKDPATSKYRITLTSKTSGAASDIAIANVDPNIRESLGFYEEADPVGNPGVYTKRVVQTGQDAQFSLDGKAYTTSSNVIADAIQGVTITLKKATVAGAATDFTIAQDSDKLGTAVDDWVTAMNDTIALIAEQTKYDSSTKEKGVLNGDNILRSIQSTLKSVLSSTVPGLPSGLSGLSDVGVTTGAWGTRDYGKILLDKSKLTAKLASDEDGVARIFGALRKNVNVALGKTATSSPAQDPAVPIAGVTDGIYDAAQFAVAGGWQTNGVPDANNKHALTIDLGASKSIDEVTLYTPDGSAVPVTGLKDFTISYKDTQGNWKQLSSVSGFTGTSRTIGFDPVMASAIKLEVSASYGGPVKVSELEVHETNRGAAVQLYRYVNATLAINTGAIDTRDTTYTSQIKSLDDKIAKLNSRLADKQAQLKAQFDRMEQALSKLQSQGSQISAMLGQQK